ncbi:MAG: AI-2E family transporter [Bacteroidales bacterium]|nr:AI-2E family transporter [Bacteroidales bacterium]MCF8345234.1 AI-2E family transporter [Bacteroidales bacterium]MCF8352720.1 AI-2E family transporter [Bacteroidales bacterium]MCF8377302.1 AI-2E family transporter [Bacteroidales bacterium]MCF8401394.1 AI-2E family transporter [Bacteroidales bacterium]
MNERYPFPIRFLVFLLSTILVVYILIQAREYLYPIILGFLFSYLLLPIAAALEKRNVPRILANLISILIGVVIISGFVFFVYSQVSVLLEDFPEIKKQASKNVNEIVATINEFLGMDDHELKDILNKRVNNIFTSSSNFLSKVFTATTGTVVKIGLMPVYVFLFLYYRTKIAVFFLKVVPDDKRHVVVKIMKEIAEVTKKYMGGVFAVVAILCVLNSTGLWIIGMDYPIVLGVLSALFNFIPYFGTLIGGFVPLTYAILAASSPVFVFRVIILFIIIQFTENNILTPNISGGAVKINPMVTIFSIVAAGMVWGIPGMFAIIPLMGMLKIVLANLPDTQSYAFLIGTKGTKRHAINRENFRKLYKHIFK